MYILMIGLLPQLPSPKTFTEDRKNYVGPTDESNWVIQGKLLVGAYPGCTDDDVHFSTLQSILRCKVTTFISLQNEYVHLRNLNESSSANKLSFASSKNTKYGAIRPYIWDAYNLCNSGNNNFVSASKLRMLHVPIRDCDTTEDEIVVDIATVICFRILVLHEVVYLHCWGGHGRAGTIAAIVLGLLYGVCANEALKRIQLYHDMRTCHLGVPSPQTSQQRQQVVRILDRFHDVKLLEPKWWKDSSKNAILQRKFVVKIADETVDDMGAKKQKVILSSPSSSLSAHDGIESKCKCKSEPEKGDYTCVCDNLTENELSHSHVEIESKQIEGEPFNNNNNNKNHIKRGAGECNGAENISISPNSHSNPRITDALRTRFKNKYHRGYIRPLKPPLSV
mmetsp:Transcript_1304/g.1669  ORF Transcript_1304/g.1669 Transcript_1304/m.1669 type:complete len:394 (+) Transcript_1304:83-1264(+)